MNRLQKKCFIASAGLHLLLLGILVFGAAFSSLFVTPAKPTQLVHFISANIVDQALSSGGRPEVQVAPPQQPAAAAPAVQPPAETKPPMKAAPTPVEIPVIETPKIRPTHSTFTVPEKKKKKDIKPVKPEEDTVEKPAKKPSPKIDPDDLKLVKRNNTEVAKSRGDADARAKAQADARRRDQINRMIKELGRGFSASVDTALTGTDGPQVTNYRDLVASTYTYAWNPPDGLNDDSATVTANVTVGRDGRVIEAHVITRSGNSSMDRSIQITLENVTFIAPFPEGSKDQQRTFTIKFNLQAKRLLG